MQHEKKVLKHFFKSIRMGDAKEYQHGDIYEKLIFYRFEEVLLATYPMFHTQIGAKRWKKLIKGFIATETTTPFIWKMPKKFGKFVRSQMKKPKYLKDLLWYEWKEVELMMATRKRPKTDKIDFSKPYKIGKSASVRRFSYPVMYGAFKPKGDYWIVMYQSASGDVEWIEVTPFMGELIKQCDGQKPLMQCVKKVAKKYGVDSKDAKVVLKKGLKGLLKEGVLV
ncbi:MAG: hypothetical protein DSY46_04080 [Hydrogenimonas sp.]|nr:MAG: hypothetical protein DSY46_04080 [Hydrogenimonas sp.]